VGGDRQNTQSRPWRDIGCAIRFEDLCSLLERLGFEVRVKGSHHVFRLAGVEEMINLQRDGNKAKPYQVRQVRAVILRNRLVEME
jgi:hypothetical protein